MPTYEYICKACGFTFDVFEGYTPDPRCECRKCDSSNVERQIGAGSAVIFKGSGFYCNDYKK